MGGNRFEDGAHVVSVPAANAFAITSTDSAIAGIASISFSLWHLVSFGVEAGDLGFSCRQFGLQSIKRIDGELFALDGLVSFRLEAQYVSLVRVDMLRSFRDRRIRLIEIRLEAGEGGEQFANEIDGVCMRHR